VADNEEANEQREEVKGEGEKDRREFERFGLEIEFGEG